MSAKGVVLLWLSCVAAQGPSLLSGLLAAVAAGGELSLEASSDSRAGCPALASICPASLSLIVSAEPSLTAGGAGSRVPATPSCKPYRLPSGFTSYQDYCRHLATVPDRCACHLAPLSCPKHRSSHRPSYRRHPPAAAAKLMRSTPKRPAPPPAISFLSKAAPSAASLDRRATSLGFATGLGAGAGSASETMTLRPRLGASLI